MEKKLISIAIGRFNGDTITVCIVLCIAYWSLTKYATYNDNVRRSKLVYQGNGPFANVLGFDLLYHNSELQVI